MPAHSRARRAARRRRVSFQYGRERTAFGLQPLRYLFRLAEHAEHVLAEDLADVGVAVPALEELGGQQRVRRHVVEILDRLGDAVEVAADADVLDPGDLLDVIDVVGDVSNRGGRRRVGGGPLVHARLYDGRVWVDRF